MKKILYPAIIYFMMGLSIAAAENVTVTTVIPRQDQLRGKSGVVGNGPLAGTPATPLWDWRTVSLTDNQFYVGVNNGLGMGIGTTSPIRALHLYTPHVNGVSAPSSEMVMEVGDGLADYRRWNFVLDGGTGNAQEFCIRQLNDAGSGGNIPFRITGGASPQVQFGGMSFYTDANNYRTIDASAGSGKINLVAQNGVRLNGFCAVYWKAYNGGNGIYCNNGAETLLFSDKSPYAPPGYAVNSDIRLKEDIVTIPDALERLQSIRGVNFRWKKGKGDNALHAGMIAQEVEKVFPEVVQTGKEGMKSITYGQFAGVLVEAVKDLKKENDELKRQNRSLADRIALLQKNK
jgi:hypothetical protein